MALPDDLIAAVAEGRAGLFLGAGASRGAKDNRGKEILFSNGISEENAVGVELLLFVIVFLLIPPFTYFAFSVLDIKAVASISA